MTTVDFQQLLNVLAQAWHARDYDLVVSLFAEKVVYTDPTRYLMNGKDELLQFFRQDDGYPQYTIWHNVLFDEARQVGAAEYTYRGTYQYHGVVMIKIDDGLITRWREYQHVSDRDYETFAGGTLFK